MIKIIDHKKVEMTSDEFKMYEKICKTYDNPPSQKGKDLFMDLFETDDDGLIVFLKPPGERVCSFEVYLFVVNLMVSQHLKSGYKKIDERLAAAEARIDAKLKELDR